MTRDQSRKWPQGRRVSTAHTRAGLGIDGFDEAVVHPEDENFGAFAELSVPGGDEGATVEDIEDLLADLQLEGAGLAGCDPEPAVRRARRLGDEIAFLGLTRLVAELTGDTAPPTPSAIFALEADEDARLASCARQRAEAGELVEATWQWLSARRRAADGQPWWSTGRLRPLPPGTLRRLVEVAEPVPDLAPIAESWARTAGLRDGAAEHNWRWLMHGEPLCRSAAPAGHGLPRLNELLAGLVAEARSHGLLPPTHKVKLIRRPGTVPRATPVRMPGFSLLSAPTQVTPATVRQLQRHIAALTEHAMRPKHAPLAERWTLDPLRSAGWALLLVHRVHSPELLVRLGLEEHTAVSAARFLAEHERFCRGLSAVDLALDAAIGECRSADGALDAAAAVAERTGLRMAPELLLLRQPRILNRRSHLAAGPWHGAVREALTGRFGNGWAQQDEAWALLLNTLTSTDTAAAFLGALAAPGRTGRGGRRPGFLVPAGAAA
ncbi:hypothetical protein OHT93_34635 [Streptomyces sp. NBC_00191]|uniref:hypothetical protein n=1 Tax=Streptomyces sp. NBC_00191 TaxID=2975674 RepID=UPI00324CC857